jgi:hypothetical protein
MDFMKLHDELYFEITAEGAKSALLQFSSFLTSGVLDDFFEVTEDYIIPDDDFNSAEGNQTATFVFTNDEYPIEIDSFNPEAFLDVLCKGGEELHLSGQLFDSDDTEFRFISPAGDSSFTDAEKIDLFNDELDAKALEEEMEANDEDDEY